MIMVPYFFTKFYKMFFRLEMTSYISYDFITKDTEKMILTSIKVFITNCFTY